MKAVFQSEYLKLKGAGQRMFSVVLPLVAIFIAFLLAGPAILESFAIYWWEALFLFTLMGLLFLYDRKAEEQAGRFQNIHLAGFAYPIQLAKISLLFLQVIFASLFFMVLLYLVSLLFPSLMSVAIVCDSLSLLLLLVASCWNIPLLYYAATWVNPYVLVVGNSFLCFLVAPFLAQTSFWYLFPYTYHYKVAYVLLALKPSGDVEVTTISGNWQTVLLALGLSLLLGSVLTALLKERK